MYVRMMRPKCRDFTARELGGWSFVEGRKGRSSAGGIFFSKMLYNFQVLGGNRYVDR